MNIHHCAGVINGWFVQPAGNATLCVSGRYYLALSVVDAYVPDISFDARGYAWVGRGAVELTAIGTMALLLIYQKIRRI